MGQIKIPQSVKLISGLLAGDEGWLERGRAALAERFGPVDLESEVIPFDFTSFYEKELGKEVLRQYISFENLIPPGGLVPIKLATNEMESGLSGGGLRKVNLDPGWLDLSKMILATTKDATYRVYLGEGIYGQSTLFYMDGTFRPWEWTYPDYRQETAVTFFNRVREVYKKQLREKGGEKRAEKIDDPAVEW